MAWHGNSNQYGNSVFEINVGARSICLEAVVLGARRRRRLRNAAPAKSAGLMRAIGPRRKKHERVCVCVDIYTLGEHQGRRAISASAPARTQPSTLNPPPSLNLLIFKGERVLIQFLHSPWTVFFAPLRPFKRLFES
jgi:hypothetical protein